MMRNEDFSEGYFSGRLWASAWNGQDEMFASDVKEYIDTAVIGTLDRRFWSEGFCYGAKAERREQINRVIALGGENSDDEELPAEDLSSSYQQEAA